RMRHFSKARDGAGCRATAEMWERLGRTDPESLYTAACMRAVTAAGLRAGSPPGPAPAAAGEAGRAMGQLRRAVAAGFRGAARVRKDRDLDALRDREDFKALLARME